MKLGRIGRAADSLHLSRLRGRSYRIEDAIRVGLSLLNDLSRGDTPTPTLPRKREREFIRSMQMQQMRRV